MIVHLRIIMKSIFLCRWALFAGAFLAALSPLHAQSVRTTIEVRPADGRPVDPTFLATQAEVIQKSEILLPVIHRYKNLKEPEQPELEAVRILRECITVKRVGNSALLEVTLSRPKGQGPLSDGVVAAQALRIVVQVYRERCISDRMAPVEQKLNASKEELERLNDRMEVAAAKVAEVRQRLKVVDSDPESSSVVPGKFEDLEKAISAKTIAVKQLSIRCEALGKLPPGEVLGSLEALGLSDSVIQHLLPKLAEVEAREASLLASGTSEKDAKIGELRALRDAYRRKCVERQESILKGQHTALKVEQDTLAAMKAEFAEQRNKTSAGQSNPQEYIDAKEKYLAVKALVRTMEQKYTDLRSESGTYVDPVIVREHPVPFPPTPPL